MKNGIKSGTNKMDKHSGQTCYAGIFIFWKKNSYKINNENAGKDRLSDQLVDQMSVFSFAHFQKDRSVVHRKSMLFLMWIGNCICAKVLNAGITAL